MDLQSRLLTACPSANSIADLCQHAVDGWPAAWSVELVAHPGQALTTRLRAGDILLRWALGGSASANVGMLETGKLFPGDTSALMAGLTGLDRFAIVRHMASSAERTDVAPLLGVAKDGSAVFLDRDGAVVHLARIVDTRGNVPQDQAILRMRQSTEHQTAGARVLRAGAVGPAVDGTLNQANVGIVNPSGALQHQNTVAQIRHRINALTPNLTVAFLNEGHNVDFDLAPGEPSLPHVAAGYRLAGTDAQRWAALRWGLFDGATQAAIAIRGGHGATRLLDEFHNHVEAAKARQWPLISDVPIPAKRIAGYSDFTAVLLAAYSRLGWAGIHGPMLAAGGNAASRASLARALTLAPADLHANNLVANLHRVGPRPNNDIRGVMLGGNLAIVNAMYGSQFFPSLEGALLLVEEVNEQGRKIDRMIEGLKHRGAAGQVKAVVVGRTTNINSNAVATLFQRSWNVPCVSGLTFGHGAGNTNLALWVGLEYELQFPQAGGAHLFLRP